MKFIDHPVVIQKSEYTQLSKKIVRKLSRHPSIDSIYQMGSVKHPGISDLDIICIFKDNSFCDLDIRNKLSNHEKKILTHDVFGVQQSDFERCVDYNYISNLRLLSGDALSDSFIFDKQTSTSIQQQIAFEYLLKMYFVLDMQITYGVIKLRSFLLEAKAIVFDLQLLEIEKGELYDLVEEVVNMREFWFKSTPSLNKVECLVVSFHKALFEFLEVELSRRDFYLPSSRIKISKNINIIYSKNFQAKHFGFALPEYFYFFGRKYINLQNRTNRFTYSIPFKIPGSSTWQLERFNYLLGVYRINKNQFPNFIPMTTSLSLYD